VGSNIKLIVMATKKQKLELTWIGKDEEVKLEPRILIEDPAKSYGDPESENMLIHGDNLLALKALEQDFAGKIKCIYIDPPYNIDAATDHYDDMLEHSEWLNLMKPRLELLQKLLAKDGVIFIQIDDYEQAYLKVLMDGIFKRINFVNCIAVKMSEASGVKMAHEKKRFPKIKEYLLLYKNNDFGGFIEIDKYEDNNWDKENNIYLEDLTVDDRNQLISIEEKDTNDNNDLIQANDILSRVKKVSLTEKIKELNIDNCDEIIKWKFTNSYRIIKTAGSASLARLVKSFSEIPDQDIAAGLSPQGILFYYITDFNRETKQPRLQAIFADTGIYKNPCDFWQDIKTTGAIAKEGGVEFPNSKKPEKLLERVIKMTTNEGDIVLDSFLGSGTTSAVAHKMNRKWIGIELGEHANTHCIPRLKSVVDGSDQSGISKAMDWNGGGGFKFYNLAPSLLHKDAFGNWVIEEKYNPNMLAHAVCKHEGFVFRPDEEIYWKQGKSTETDFIFVTTNYITVEQLDRIHEEMKEGESLLICAKSYAPECEDKYVNITVKKIPQTILGKCEFNKENYDLNIIESTEEVAEEQSNHENENE